MTLLKWKKDEYIPSSQKGAVPLLSYWSERGETLSLAKREARFYIREKIHFPYQKGVIYEYEEEKKTKGEGGMRDFCQEKEGRC